MKPRLRTFATKRPSGTSPVERALIAKEWHATAVRAQIHAILGDDSDEFVNAAGRVMWVVLGAAIREDVDHDIPEVRILRGACNALYDQAGEASIDPTRRAAIRAGLEACFFLALLPLSTKLAEGAGG